MSSKEKSMYTVPKLTDFSDATLVAAVDECIQACQAEADVVQTETGSKALRDRWLGRKAGILTQINEQWLRAAPKDAKRNVGVNVNELRLQIEIRVTGAERSVSDQSKPRSLDPAASISPFPAFGAHLGRSIRSSRR